MTDFFSKKDVQKLLDAEDRDIEAFVSKLKNKVERQLRKAANNLNEAGTLNKVASELNKLSALNLPKDVQAELNKYVNLYQKSIKVIEDSIKTANNIEQVFTQEDQGVINQLYDFSKTRLVTSMEQTFNEFKSAIYQGMVSKQLPNLDTVISTVTDTMESRLPSEINTQLSAYQRAVSTKKADDLGLTHALYAGGLIRTSRPFCIERAGKVFSRAEINSWDNGTSLPANIYLGSWNCRHTLVWMTKEKAIELGWTG